MRILIYIVPHGTVLTVLLIFASCINRSGRFLLLTRLIFKICKTIQFSIFNYLVTKSSDGDPGPLDPSIVTPAGSGSVSQTYGSGSGSGSGFFYDQAKIVRKTLIPTLL